MTGSASGQRQYARATGETRRYRARYDKAIELGASDEGAPLSDAIFYSAYIEIQTAIKSFLRNDSLDWPVTGHSMWVACFYRGCYNLA